MNTFLIISSSTKTPLASRDFFVSTPSRIRRCQQEVVSSTHFKRIPIFWNKYFPRIPTTIKTMGVNITTIAYLRVLIIEIGSTIIFMVVEAQGFLKVSRMPSWELTYPLKSPFWRWFSFSPRWDMLTFLEGKTLHEVIFLPKYQRCFWCFCLVTKNDAWKVQAKIRWYET